MKRSGAVGFIDWLDGRARNYGRGRGVGRLLGAGAILGVGVARGVGDDVAVDVAVALGVGVGVAPDRAQYLPPVLRGLPALSRPPQTIISLPVQTAVWSCRALGALVALVAVQLSALGSYLPPVLTSVVPSHPPQMSISLPVHTAMSK